MIITSPKHLERLLRIKHAEMKSLLNEKQRLHYHFSRVKKVVNGIEQYRVFQPSKKLLKHLQNKIQCRIFSKITLPGFIQGCVKGKSNITNGSEHKGKPYKFHTDLKQFFGYVTNSKVFFALRALGFSPDVSALLTKLTTLNGHLAQGPPTSPFLANIAGLEMDKKIIALCQANGITYTRYVDDLCLSSQQDFGKLIPDIIQIISDCGFYIQPKKTSYKRGRLDITGCSVGNNTLRPTAKQLKKFYNPTTPEYTKKGMMNYFDQLRSA